MADTQVQISQADRDLAIRTMIGEESTPHGQAAVASTILNRAQSGNYGGNTPAGVVLARSQYEPWSRNPGGLLKISPNDPRYQQAAAIFDATASGKIPDLTGGATHFYAPKAQAALGRQPPSWDNGQGLHIGQSMFFAPEGRVNYQPPAGKAIATVTSEKKASSGDSDPFEDFGVVAPAAKGAKAEPAVSAPAHVDTDPFEDFGVKAEAATPVQSNGKPDYGYEPPRPDGLPQRSESSIVATQKAANGPTYDPTSTTDVAARVGDYALGQVAGIPNAISEDWQNSQALRHQGNALLASGQAMPSFPSIDPRTWSAGGVLKSIAGVAGQVSSPLTGAIRQVVQDPVTQATGNPDVGERAGIVANSLAGPAVGNLIGSAGNALASATLPQSRAAALVRSALGTNPSPELLARVAANPNLRLMDIDPYIQANALGLASEPTHPAFGILKNSANETAAAAPGVTSGAYDAAMGEAPNVKNLLDNLDATKKANAAAGYGAAFKDAKAVDISGVLDKLNKTEVPGANAVISRPANIPPSTAQQAATDIKSLLTDENGSVLTDPQRLHEIQSQLRVSAEREFQRGGMESTIRGQQLNSARQGIVDALDEATGGKYSEARVKYREDASIPEAFDKGGTIFKNNTIEDRPEYWQHWKDNASPEEIAAAKIGMRVQADRAINGMRFGARNGANIPEVPFNLEKMKIILGEDEANKLASTMADQKSIAGTNSLLFNGSKTAITHAAQRAAAVREASPFTLFGAGTMPAILANHFGAGDIGSALAASAGIGANYLGRLSDIGRNTAAARLYSMPAGNALSQVYRQAAPSVVGNALLSATPASAGLLNKPVNSLAAPYQDR